MINYVYDVFCNWFIFGKMYNDPKIGIKAHLDIKFRLLIDKYILTIKKCEDILNDKDEIQKLHSVKFMDSIVLVGNIIYDLYIQSLNDKSLKGKAMNYMRNEIDRINDFIEIIYTNYETISEEDIKMIIKEYK